ncbi:MAG: TolC family protein [Bacteroidales bacterium]|nr:TolC family protein [Bacteroidales bacterium]
MKNSFIIILILIFAQVSNAQKVLTLPEVIRLAQDSSLTAFRYKNMYMSSYWQWRNYKADRLPSLTLQLTPVAYNRQLISRYDSESDMDVYRQQKSYLANGNLIFSQNFTPLGGTFTINTSLDYLRYFGATTYNQFSSVPLSIGYSHTMFGYNKFKWDKKIEPVKFEKAKLQYIYNAEQIASTALAYFFNLAQAQYQWKNAKNQVDRCDSLYVMGQRKFQIASITKTDLMTLQLDVVNAKNSVYEAEVAVKKASLNLATYLGIDKETDIILILPDNPEEFDVDTHQAIDYMHQNSYLILEKMQSVTEAERELDRVKKQNRFTASVNASIGFNQQAEKFEDVYNDPMRRDVVSVSLAIPIVDWGVRKGQRNQAENSLNIARIDQEQNIQELEQNLIVTISELKSRYYLLQSAQETQNIAQEVYNANVQRFQNAAIDITTLSASQQRLQTALNNYVSTMYQYWQCYYSLRQQTLYDFAADVSLSEQFDFENLR